MLLGEVQASGRSTGFWAKHVKIKSHGVFHFVINDLEFLDTFIKIKSAFEATKLDFIIYKVNTFNIEISKCDTSEVTDMLDMLFGLKMYSYLLILQVRLLKRTPLLA